MTLDPLKGHREQLNRDEIDSILWPDTGQGPPLEVGQVFNLRSGGVEVSRVHRVRKGREWFWRAEFIRIHRARLWILAPRGDYTNDPRTGLPAGDDLELATTTLSVTTRPAHPPEPEAVPPYEVKRLPTTVEARERFEATRRREADHRRVARAASRLRALQKRAEQTGANLTDAILEVEDILERAEARLGKAA